MNKIIHYCWFGPKPLGKLEKKCIASWKKYLPDYKIMKWSEENVDLNECEFIKEAYAQKKWAFVADYVRTKVLYEYGGIYMDTDMEVISDLSEFENKDLVFGLEDSGEPNAAIVIANKKHNKYIKKLYDKYKKSKFNETKNLFDIAIPKQIEWLLTPIGLKLGSNEIQKLKDNVFVYPREYFYPLSYDMKNNIFTSDTKTIHHFSASWISTTSKIALWMNRHHMEKLVRFMYSFMNLFKNKNNLIISIILSLLFTLSICNFNKYEETKVKITSLHEKNSEATGYNVRIHNINSKLTNDSYKIINREKGWFFFNSELKNKSKDKSSVELILPPAKNIEIEFVKTRDSGKILLEYNGVKEKIDLYNKKWDDNLYGEQVMTYKLESKINNFLKFNNILKILFVFIISVLINLIWLKIYEKNKKAVIIPLLLIYSILFTNIGLYKIVYLDKISLVLLFILNIIIGYFISRIDDLIIKKYFDKKYKKILFLIISLINSFLFAGYQIFLSGNYINFNLMLFSKYILLTILIIAFELFIIYLYEANINKIICENKRLTKKEYLKKFLVLFSIFFGIWVISLLAHYPANMTSDTADQWAQAIGLRPISTAHPAFVAIYYRILHNLGLNVFGIALIQVFMFSFVLTYIFMYFYKQGINYLFLCILSFIISILPSSYLLVTTLWKDVPYTLFLLLMCFYTYRLLREKNNFLTIKNMFLFSISIIITYLTRHNGIGPLVFIIILLITYSITLKNYKPIFIIIISLIVIKIITGPVFNYFNVYRGDGKPKDSLFVGTVIRSTGSLVYKGKTVKKEYLDIVETNISKELLIKYFDPFNGDTYGFTEDILKYFYDNSDEPVITTKDVLEIYSWELLHYPNIIIKERLDGSSLFWTVFMPDGSFNHKYIDGIYFPDGLDGEIVGVKLNDNNYYSTQNIVVKGFRLVNKIVEKVKIFDSIVWRSGLSLMLIIILSYIMIINMNAINLLSLLPMLGNMGTWILLMSHQSFRYVWYINVILFLFILISFTKREQHEKIY